MSTPTNVEEHYVGQLPAPHFCIIFKTMRKLHQMARGNSLIILIGLVFSVWFLASCNNQPDATNFNEQAFQYSQPVTEKLEFSVEKKFSWDTTSTNIALSAPQKFDIEALPAIPIDTAGFKPFNRLPTTVKFNFNSLPQTDFSLSKLPSKKLQFTTSILPIPLITKPSLPFLQKDKPITIFDFSFMQGLPAKFVTCMVKAKNGLLWIASVEGIFRYDGVKIETILKGPFTSFINGMAEDDFGNIWYINNKGIGMLDVLNGLSNFSAKITGLNNNLSKIYKDSEGFMWVYNQADKGLSRIDPTTFTFKNIDVKDQVFEIAEDLDNNIWISTYTKGLSIINIKAGKISILNKANGLGNDSLSAIAKDSKGVMWIALGGKEGGLEAIDRKNSLITHYHRVRPQVYAFNLSFDSEGNLWKGTNDGLEVFDLVNNTSRYLTQGKGLSGTVILSIFSDNDQRQWVSTNQGINIIDQHARTVQLLQGTDVTSLSEDEKGNIWVATKNGVEIINQKKGVKRIFNTTNGLSNNFVQSFLRYDGKMVVATNGGMNVIDPVNKTLQYLGLTQGLNNDTIYSVFKDKPGNLWFSGPVNGIDVFDPIKRTLRHADTNNGLSDNDILDIKQDNEGRFWLATFHNGVNVIDVEAGTVKYLNNKPGLSDTCARQLLKDQMGRMWIGTDKGVYVADTKNNTLTTITTQNGLTSNFVLSVLEYNQEVVVGTSNKITVIKAPPVINQNSKNAAGQNWIIGPLDKSESIIKTTNSWSSDFITSNGQYLWGDAGMTVIKEIAIAKDSATTYISGMQIMTEPQYFVNQSRFKYTDTIYNGDTFFIKEKPPLKAGYSTTKNATWDSVSGPYNLPVNLQIPPGQNYLQFQFGQANLSRPDTTWYTYILEGIDKNWSAVTYNTFTENYLNLPAGYYTFKVSSKSKSGKWSTPVEFSFSITPPWYQTWWAYALFTVLFIGLLRLYIVYRSRKLKKENKLLEEKVLLRTNQLQKSLEDLTATQTQLIQAEKMASLGELTAGIAHEIQNPLNFINNFSEVNAELIEEITAEYSKDKSERNFELEKELLKDLNDNSIKIVHHGKRAGAIVKGMLQHSRNSNGNTELTDINALADEYLRLSYQGLRAKDKSFNAHIKTSFDSNIGSINVVPQDIGRVLLNLYNNAFYAARQSKLVESSVQENGHHHEPTVWVTTSRLNPTQGKGAGVLISVRDNGPGIPQNIIDKIFQPFFTTKPTGHGTGLGLSLSYDIIKAHRGEITVKTIEANSDDTTRQGHGTEFLIKLPA